MNDKLDPESIVFKESIKVNDELKAVIKSLCDIYKEIRKQGLSQTESMSLLMMIINNQKGDKK